jgi:hypothetical protein
VSLWEKILVFWVLAGVLPKVIFLPMFRAMYRAMAATDEQDEIDREWLADYERRQRRDDGLVRRRRHRRRPGPTRPRGPGSGRPPRHGATALRHRTVERRPVRAVAR